MKLRIGAKRQIILNQEAIDKTVLERWEDLPTTLLVTLVESMHKRMRELRKIRRLCDQLLTELLVFYI